MNPVAEGPFAAIPRDILAPILLFSHTAEQIAFSPSLSLPGCAAEITNQSEIRTEQSKPAAAPLRTGARPLVRLGATCRQLRRRIYFECDDVWSQVCERDFGIGVLTPEKVLAQVDARASQDEAERKRRRGFSLVANATDADPSLWARRYAVLASTGWRFPDRGNASECTDSIRIYPGGLRAGMTGTGSYDLQLVRLHAPFPTAVRALGPSSRVSSHRSSGIQEDFSTTGRIFVEVLFEAPPEQLLLTMGTTLADGKRLGVLASLVIAPAHLDCSGIARDFGTVRSAIVWHNVGRLYAFGQRILEGRESLFEFSNGDLVGMMVDRDTDTVTFYKNRLALCPPLTLALSQQWKSDGAIRPFVLLTRNVRNIVAVQNCTGMIYRSASYSTEDTSSAVRGDVR